jgi:hypothetical protein
MGPQGGARAHVHDGAAFLLEHGGEHRLHGHDGGHDVEVEDRTQVVLVEVGHRDVQPLAGAVDQHVDAPVGVEGGAGEPLELGSVGDVGRQRQGVGKLRCERLEALDPPRRQDDRCPSIGQGPRRGRADARRRPRDDADRSLDLHGLVSLFSLFGPLPRRPVPRVQPASRCVPVGP